MFVVVVCKGGLSNDSDRICGIKRSETKGPRDSKVVDCRREGLNEVQNL